MKENYGKIKGWGYISSVDARELERQQAESLKQRLNFLSSPEDKEEIDRIEKRLRAIKRLSESKD